MRITKRTNIAVRLMLYCASQPDRRVTKSEVARKCNISENHLAHVVNALGQMGYIDTQRGRSGGLELARGPDEVSLGDIFRSLESGVPLAECFGCQSVTCESVSDCRLRQALVNAEAAFYETLDEVPLAELMGSNGGGVMDRLQEGNCPP